MGACETEQPVTYALKRHRLGWGRGLAPASQKCDVSDDALLSCDSHWGCASLGWGTHQHVVMSSQQHIHMGGTLERP